jgi:hypothetical protein
VKAPEDVLVEVRRRLELNWAQVLCDPDARWRSAFTIGEPSAAELSGDFGWFADRARQWREWAADQGVELRMTSRRVAGTNQVLPTHVVVSDLSIAARMCGESWPERLERGRRRADTMASTFAHLADPAELTAVVRATVGYSELDFDLLVRAGRWFAENDARGLTPRQVPIGGMHAKWLNTRREWVRRLAGVADLGLLPPHAGRVHFTYLDPDHRAHRGRWHDSATVGDAVCLPYRPRVVVISENKDTAIWFPPMIGGVSVEGVGRGAATIAALDWVAGAERLFYWGDMDADGLEILNEFRAAGLPVVSVLMDLAAYSAWERYGTNFDPKGQPVGPRPPRPVPFLSPREAELYEGLCSTGWSGYRRVEQERIPLDVAWAAVAGHVPPPGPDA